MNYCATGCWSCHHPINSYENSKCPICGWIICPVCGACREYECVSSEPAGISMPDQVVFRRHLRDAWLSIPRGNRPIGEKLRMWTTQEIAAEHKRREEKQQALLAEKNKIEEDNLRFLEFLQSGPYVKNHLSSFSGRICEVHAPRDYKWFAFSVAYSDSEKKKYSVDTKARFLELFEVDEEKVFAEEFHKM